jgi:hypothetical protein
VGFFVSLGLRDLFLSLFESRPEKSDFFLLEDRDDRLDLCVVFLRLDEILFRSNVSLGLVENVLLTGSGRFNELEREDESRGVLCDSLDNPFETNLDDRVEMDFGERVEIDLDDRVGTDLDNRVGADLDDRVETDLGDRVEADLGDLVETDLDDRVETDPGDRFGIDLDDRERDVRFAATIEVINIRTEVSQKIFQDFPYILIHLLKLIRLYCS